MQTPAQLVPGVEEGKDRLTFRVQSRSRQRKHLVDLEAKHGLGECQCEDCQINNNLDCYHLQQARKYFVVRVVLKMKQNQATSAGIPS